MEKRGQLAAIEFHYFLGGFVVGLIAGLVTIYLGTAKIIGFQVPVVCGFFKNKKAQLAGIEFHYFLAGLALGLIGACVMVFLSTRGIIPFSIPVCPVLTK